MLACFPAARNVTRNHTMALFVSGRHARIQIQSTATCSVVSIELLSHTPGGETPRRLRTYVEPLFLLVWGFSCDLCIYQRIATTERQWLHQYPYLSDRREPHFRPGAMYCSRDACYGRGSLKVWRQIFMQRDLYVSLNLGYYQYQQCPKPERVENNILESRKYPRTLWFIKTNGVAKPKRVCNGP